MSMDLIVPRVIPPLDQEFRPAILANQAFRRSVAPTGVRLVIGLKRSDDGFSRLDLRIHPEDHPDYESNYQYVERMLKFLLWQRGGFALYVGGSRKIAQYLRETYSPNGTRKFDHQFMGEEVYERPFTVTSCEMDQMPAARETGKMLGRNLNGHRIGFDLGASDRKVSAVVDGTPVFSEEVVWEPRQNSDPDYHYREIMSALKTAAGKMPRVDAIGGSSAGIYIDNRPMVASLFRGIPRKQYDRVRDMFLRIREEMGVPLEVINDGDVTALAGSMSIEENSILGIALGSSEAAGYVNAQGHIMGWLNELAFAPVDYSPLAPVEEWSGDRGCGASYFSQQCVFRLAPRAGIEIPAEVPDAEKLELIQAKLATGHEGALQIWQSMGIYLGYGIAHYAEFYDLKHILILGRCTSGRGGELLLENARKVFEMEFPDLLAKIELHLPDEKARRVGQSIAAASLPVVRQE